MSAELDSDADLMLRVQRGELAAFEQLVTRYQQPVMNLVARMLRDPTEAEDLAQNVFLQVYKSADRYRVSAKFTTWLFTIARNLCLNEIRRRGRHPADSLDELHAEHEHEPRRQFADAKSVCAPAAVLHAELVGKIEEAIAALPDNQRLALLLFREEEMAYEDIAQVLDCSLSATKSLIHRARETLKERLKPYLRTGEWTEDEL